MSFGEGEEMEGDLGPYSRWEVSSARKCFRQTVTEENSAIWHRIRYKVATPDQPQGQRSPPRVWIPRPLPRLWSAPVTLMHPTDPALQQDAWSGDVDTEAQGVGFGGYRGDNMGRTASQESGGYGESGIASKVRQDRLDSVDIETKSTRRFAVGQIVRMYREADRLNGGASWGDRPKGEAERSADTPPVVDVSSDSPSPPSQTTSASHSRRSKKKARRSKKQSRRSKKRSRSSSRSPREETSADGTSGSDRGGSHGGASAGKRSRVHIPSS